jgi:hypothetical protein
MLEGFCCLCGRTEGDSRGRCMNCKYQCIEISSMHLEEDPETDHQRAFEATILDSLRQAGESSETDSIFSTAINSEEPEGVGTLPLLWVGPMIADPIFISVGNPCLELARFISRVTQQLTRQNTSDATASLESLLLGLMAVLLGDSGLGSWPSGALQANDFAPEGFDAFETFLNDLFQQALATNANKPTGPPGLSDAELAVLPRQSAKAVPDSGTEQCAICQEPLSIGGTERSVPGSNSNDQLILLPCTHCYHEVCITPWITRVASCPVCRRTVQAPSHLL